MNACAKLEMGVKSHGNGCLGLEMHVECMVVLVELKNGNAI